jgi:hypothetical protein
MMFAKRDQLPGNARARWAAWAAGFWLLVAWNARAADVPTSPTQATAPFYLQVEPAEAQIGDPVRVMLRARDPQPAPDAIEEVTFEPDAKLWESNGGWHREWNKDKGGDPKDLQAGAWCAQLRPFALGELAIPATTVHWRNAQGERVQTQATTATLRVRSIRPAGAQADQLIGLRDPAQIPRDWTWLYYLAAVILAAGIAGWGLRRWLKRRARPAIAPAAPERLLPPGLWALEELDRRSRLPFCLSGPAKAVFTSVSEVIRIYLDRRFGIPAIEMTTLECLRALQGQRLPQEVLRWAQEFLEECDRVKFTKIEPERERWATIWNDARLIVKMTTPPEELGVGEAARPDAALREAAE